MNIDTLHAERTKKKPIPCMHGLGAYKGLRQTNTKEAFLYWYSRNVRIFEFDIATTADGEYVAVAHSVDRKSMYRMEITEIPEDYTCSWFMKQRLFPLTTNGLTPLSLFDILDLLNEYADCVFILDMFGLFEATKIETFMRTLVSDDTAKAVQRRLLIEVYNMDMANAVASFEGYETIYCARYEGNLEAKAVDASMLMNQGIRFVSYPWKYVKAYTREIDNYSKAGLIVFSRTKYSTKSKELMTHGVTVNIVDFVFESIRSLFSWLSYMWACSRRLLNKYRMKRANGDSMSCCVEERCNDISRS